MFQIELPTFFLSSSNSFLCFYVFYSRVMLKTVGTTSKITNEQRSVK